jgi:hypothetical protein
MGHRLARQSSRCATNLDVVHAVNAFRATFPAALTKSLRDGLRSVGADGVQFVGSNVFDDERATGSAPDRRQGRIVGRSERVVRVEACCRSMLVVCSTRTTYVVEPSWRSDRRRQRWGPAQCRSVPTWVSVELAEERFGGLDDDFRHLDVGAVDDGGRVVGDEAAQLVQLELPLAEQSFEDCQHVND